MLLWQCCHWLHHDSPCWQSEQALAPSVHAAAAGKEGRLVRLLMAALPLAAASGEARMKQAAAAALGARAPTGPALACPCRLAGAATAGQRSSPEGANHTCGRVGAVAARILKEAAAAVLGAWAPTGPALACSCRLSGAATAQ